VTGNSRREQLKLDPERFDLMGILREFERSEPDKPRIGKSQVTSQEIVRLGQDPFLAFPSSNVDRYSEEQGKPPSIRSRFLGFFGPQGALPLTTTLEAYHWQRRRDDAFVRFVDIFTIRFLQLFYRAWADARPISQFDRPEEDRFACYIGSFIGIGTEPFRNRDRVPDIAKLPYAGLLASRVKSASRLEQALRGMLGVDVHIREREGMWLDFEDADLTRIGESGAHLGQNTYLGQRVYSINDKAVIELHALAPENYDALLPGGVMFARLADLVAFYLGDTLDFDVELALPQHHRRPMQLGQSGQLGWNAWAAPPKTDNMEFVSDAKFSLRQAG
jgi:type VI secretion system protein ImpH